MSSTLTIGPIDLTDRTKYRWRQLPQKKNYSLRERDWRGQNRSRLTYRKLTSITLEFEVVCLGDDMDDARVQEVAIEDMLEDAADWSIGRTDRDFVGTEILFTEAAGGESPRIWSVRNGVWEEHDQALWGLDAPQIHGHLSLTLLPYLGGVRPYPIRLRMELPAPTIVLGATVITPSPVTIPIAIAAPVVVTLVNVTPNPVHIPVETPAPVVAAALPFAVTPTPVTIPIAIPVPTALAGILVLPDPVAIPIVVPTATGVLGNLLTPDPVTIPMEAISAVVDPGIPPAEQPLMEMLGGWGL